MLCGLIGAAGNTPHAPAANRTQQAWRVHKMNRRLGGSSRHEVNTAATQARRHGMRCWKGAGLPSIT